MTSPGLGQSLIELGNLLKSGEPVDPGQIGAILVHVWQSIATLEREVAWLRSEVTSVNLVRDREYRGRGW